MGGNVLTQLSGVWGIAGAVTRVDPLRGGGAKGLINGTGERMREGDRWERGVRTEGERKMSRQLGLTSRSRN